MIKRVTIYDIAARAGVSTKTVSKVLNNKPGVGAATRSRVQSIIEECGYHPHHGARTLRGRARNCVGVTLSPPLDLVPLSQDFLLWLFAKLTGVFASRGAFLSFDIAPRTGASTNSDYGRGVWEQMYDVCLVVGPLPIGDPVIRRIDASGIPYVAIGRLDGFPECSSAVVDFQEGARQSARFLLERGHRRIGLVASFEGYQAGVDRVRGYRQALEEFGVTPDETLIRYVSPTPQSIVAALKALMGRSDVTGVIDSSVGENSDLFRQAETKTGRIIGRDVEFVIWTYMRDAAVVPEAAAHVWLPVREATLEGIEQLSRWASGRRVGPIKVVLTPVLTDAAHTLEVRKPTRISELL